MGKVIGIDTGGTLTKLAFLNEEGQLVLDDYIRSCGCDMIVASTAEGNQSVRKNSKLGGYKELAYESFKTANYYSVIFAKWFDGCPFPDNFSIFLS